MRQISILGCGWLGLPLAKSLLEKGFSVKGSTTSAAKIPILEAVGIDAFQIELGETRIQGNMESFLESSEILIVDIPPKLRGNTSENFVKKIQNAISLIKEAKIPKVIFISSTSVYSDNYRIVTEATKAEPDTESGKQLLEAEHLLLAETLNFRTTVVRFGGLIGEGRHPIHHLAGKTNLENPGATINLIHQSDCIGIIEAVIDKDCWNQTFNAVAPFHPNRKEYYVEKAAKLGLPLPEFREDTNSFGKIIQSNLIESQLDYHFKKPNL